MAGNFRLRNQRARSRNSVIDVFDRRFVGQELAASLFALDKHAATGSQQRRFSRLPVGPVTSTIP